jgi:hypothetical protein
MRATNGIPIERPLPLTDTTSNCVTPLQAGLMMITTTYGARFFEIMLHSREKRCWNLRRC